LVGASPYIFGNHFGSAMAYKVSETMVAHSLSMDFGAAQSGIAAGIATFKRE